MGKKSMVPRGVKRLKPYPKILSNKPYGSNGHMKFKGKLNRKHHK